MIQPLKLTGLILGFLFAVFSAIRFYQQDPPPSFGYDFYNFLHGYEDLEAEWPYQVSYSGHRRKEDDFSYRVQWIRFDADATILSVLVEAEEDADISTAFQNPVIEKNSRLHPLESISISKITDRAHSVILRFQPMDRASGTIRLLRTSDTSEVALAVLTYYEHRAKGENVWGIIFFVSLLVFALLLLITLLTRPRTLAQQLTKAITHVDEKRSEHLGRIQGWFGISSTGEQDRYNTVKSAYAKAEEALFDAFRSQAADDSAYIHELVRGAMLLGGVAGLILIIYLSVDTRALVEFFNSSENAPAIVVGDPFLLSRLETRISTLESGPTRRTLVLGAVVLGGLFLIACNYYLGIRAARRGARRKTVAALRNYKNRLARGTSDQTAAVETEMSAAQADVRNLARLLESKVHNLDEVYGHALGAIEALQRQHLKSMKKLKRRSFRKLRKDIKAAVRQRNRRYVQT